uniref:DM5 domain-containing protein n=1 Tax=Anopheles melas TaxID=34690 RepID=A0A182TDW0_9DIPT
MPMLSLVQMLSPALGPMLTLALVRMLTLALVPMLTLALVPMLTLALVRDPVVPVSSLVQIHSLMLAHWPETADTTLSELLPKLMPDPLPEDWHLGPSMARSQEPFQLTESIKSDLGLVLATCLAVATADIGLKLRQGAAAGSSSYAGSQGAVSIDYAPTVFEDTVVDGAASGASGRSFGGASSFGGAGSYGGASSGASSGAYAGAASSAQYNQAGLFGGAGASAGSSATAGSFGGVGSFAGSNANSFATGSSSGASASASSSANAEVKIIRLPPVIKKNFYYHVAQDDTIAETDTNTLTITPRKHYKVIFIKAPSASANAGASSQAASQTEEKTIVYVLVNKPAKANANSEADASSYSSGKPEVYFVKYQGAQATSNSVSTSQSGGSIAISDANAVAGTNAISGAGANAYSRAGANAYSSDGAGSGSVGINAGGTSFANAGASAGARIDALAATCKVIFIKATRATPAVLTLLTTTGSLANPSGWPISNDPTSGGPRSSPANQKRYFVRSIRARTRGRSLKGRTVGS